MDIGDYVTIQDELQIHIRKVENGWSVKVLNPPPPKKDPTEKMYRAIAEIVPQIQNIAGHSMARGVEEEVDAYKENDADRESSFKSKTDLLMKAVDKAFSDGPRPLRKPQEEYVFLDHAALVKFVSECTKL